LFWGFFLVMLELKVRTLLILGRCSTSEHLFMCLWMFWDPACLASFTLQYHTTCVVILNNTCAQHHFLFLANI
jgi:hypothetical protein